MMSNVVLIILKLNWVWPCSQVKCIYYIHQFGLSVRMLANCIYVASCVYKVKIYMHHLEVTMDFISLIVILVRVPLLFMGFMLINYTILQLHDYTL